MPCQSTTGSELSLCACRCLCRFCGTCALMRTRDAVSATQDASTNATTSALQPHRLRLVLLDNKLAVISGMLNRMAKALRKQRI